MNKQNLFKKLLNDLGNDCQHFAFCPLQYTHRQTYELGPEFAKLFHVNAAWLECVNTRLAMSQKLEEKIE
jgi:hypothetical protein